MGTSKSTGRSGHRLMKTMPILSHNHRHQYGYHQNYQRSFLHIQQTMVMSSFLTSPSTAYQEPELRLSLRQQLAIDRDQMMGQDKRKMGACHSQQLAGSIGKLI